MKTMAQFPASELDSEMHESRQPLGTDEGACLAAVVENRAKEVGLAVMHRASMRLYLCQHVESSRTYINTLSLLGNYQPSKLVIVASSQEVLTTGVNRATRLYSQVPLGRACFDDSKGALLVNQYATPETRSDVQSNTHQSAYYLAFAAGGALLQYLEQEHNSMLAAGSLHVDYIGPEHHMQIDQATVQALELIRPLKLGAGPSKRTSSLFNMLNYCKTLVGAKLLKANLLQPLLDIPTLTLRYECVAELLAESDMQLNLAQCLTKMPRDLDKVCGTFAVKAVKATANPTQRISTIVGSVILLKETLQMLPALADCLESAQSPLLQAVRKNCGHPCFDDLLQRATSILDEEAASAKQAFVNRTQQCFAVKSGTDGFLDLARDTFCKVTEQIHQLADHYRSEYGMENLKVCYSARRSFYLATSLPGSDTKNGPAPALPRGFTQIEIKNRTTIHCTTHELNALNSRLTAASQDCMLFTEQVLESLVVHVSQSLGLLHKLVDNIALVDMLASFAETISQSDEPYVQPQLTPSGPIAFVEGRHPIMERCEDVSFESNDTYLADCSSLYIISGPNMSGKSTYLRQVALITILAQIGCFVPAKFASLQPVDRLFTRIGTSDSIETNSSSFLVEMEETAYIVNHATSRSLVIIDELGRATSTCDGVGIAWAVCEHLISLGAYTLFATHFPYLADLATIYPNCKQWHFDVDTDAGRLDLTWKLKSGRQSAKHYGLLLAPLVGFPQQIVEEARKISEMLDDNASKRADDSAGPDSQLAIIYSLAHKVLCIANSWAQNPAGIDIQKQLQRLKKESRKALPAGFDKSIMRMPTV